MNRILYAVVLLGMFAGVIGCGQKEPTAPVSGGVTTVPAVSSAPTQASTVESAGQGAAVRHSPIEYAQKEYLDSYNDYVRLLRESGPQTIETLQALAIYQKKYQIYQMLLKADGDRKP